MTINASKEIGGYFSLELPQRENAFLHSEGVLLNSGRHALEYILRSISVVKRLWLPYFTCDVILEPIIKLAIPYDFYHINEQLEIIDDISLQSDEYLLVTNYYGIKDTYINFLVQKYNEHLIIDNAQAFYTVSDFNVPTIYSPRKFVGVPDGGIAVVNQNLPIDDLERDVSYNRCIHLLKRIDLGANAGYFDFKENSSKLINQPMKKMSFLTQAILSSIDWEDIRKKRVRNFQILHEVLSASNSLSISSMGTFACPMIYPYLTQNSTLKKKLINSGVFVATYWPNVFDWCPKGSLEHHLAENIIAIPIDQRYGLEDLNKILTIIQK